MYGSTSHSPHPPLRNLALQSVLLPIFGKVRPQFHNIQTKPFFYFGVLCCHHVSVWFRNVLEWCAEHKRDVCTMNYAKPVRQERVHWSMVEQIDIRWSSSLLEQT